MVPSLKPGAAPGHPGDVPVPGDAAVAPDLVAELEQGLRSTVRVSIPALLTGTALIRVAASGVTVAV